MRWRAVYLIAAAFLAALHVLGVLTGTPPLPTAEVGTFALLLAFATLSAAHRRTPAPPGVGPVRWMVPVALLPLLAEALLTIPRVPAGGFGWQVLVPGQERDRNAVVEALNTTFEIAGPQLLFATTLLVVALVAYRFGPVAGSGGRGAGPFAGSGGRGPVRWPWPVAALGLLPGLAVTGYAAVRVLRVADAAEDASAATADRLAVLLVVAVPVLVAAAATTLLAVTLRAGRPGAAAGGLLLAVSALPMIDAAIIAVPLPYRAVRSAGQGLFGWDAITPSLAMPAPVPAVTLAAQLLACFLLVTALSRRS